MRIVIDALGSDDKLNDILDGIAKAMQNIKKYDFTVIGPKDYISKYLENKIDFNRLEIIDANTEVDDATNPLGMLRDLNDTALVKSLKRLKEDDTIGLLTASNTGCVFVGSIMHVGLTSKNLMAPVLCCLIKDINLKDICLADCGANINSTSESLLTYAKYANAFVKSYFNVSNPKIGLISNGSSDKKGDNLIKGANKLLRDSDLNFVGNIEASNIYNSDVDALVCDGMLGNVILKNSEAVANTIINMTSDEKLISKIKSMYDYSNLGASFLLGTKKMICKMHGNVSSQTIESVSNLLVKLYENDYISKIENI